MSKRAILAAATAALALSSFGGTAHASCLDDLLARDLREGFQPSPKSEHWTGLTYVQVSGTATVFFYGDALVSDAALIASDRVQQVDVVSGNAVDAATDFADCVAG